MGVGYCPEERGIFAALSTEENLLLPPRLKGAQGMQLAEIYDIFPNLLERANSPGDAAVGRGAADAGGGANPADRRALVAAG